MDRVSQEIVDEIRKKSNLANIESVYKEAIRIAEEYINRQPLEQKPEWISVKDRLPELNQPIRVKKRGSETPYYAVYSNENEFDVHIIGHTEIYRKTWYKYSSRTISHWMPLTEFKTPNK